MNLNEFVPIDWKGQGGSIIKVIGVGGGGNNAVKNMFLKGIEGVDFVVCNTDDQVLSKSPVQQKIQLGVTLTRGLGTGCDPEQGRKAAIENLDDVKKVLEDNAEMVFITAGMGGGTGTGATPIIAKEAKEMGILTVAIVTLPFRDEGEEPFNRALDGLQELRKYVDSLLVIDNQKLYDIYPDLSVFDAFPKADDILAAAAKGIAELITKEGYINVDFADVKMVMKNSGMALMGFGRAAGENRALTAAGQALTSPLLNDSDISGAKNILVNIGSGTKIPLKMSELGQIMNFINNASGGKANFKRGVTMDAELEDEITVTIVATGFSVTEIVEIEINNDEDPEIIKYDDNPIEDSEFYDTATSVDLTGNSDNISVRTAGAVNESAENEKKPIKTTDSRSHTQLKAKDITQMEDVPAFERKNINIKSKSESEISKYKLTEKDGEYRLREENTFLNKKVD